MPGGGAPPNGAAGGWLQAGNATFMLVLFGFVLTGQGIAALS
jgi:hypothetical protein